MSMGPRYSDLASELLARSAPEPTAPREEDRLLAIRAVKRAMRHKARRRLALRAGSAAAIVAAAASFALWIAMKPAAPFVIEAPIAATLEVVSGSAVAVRGGREMPLATNAPLAAGDRIVARDASRARIKLATGTTLFIEEGSDVSIVEHAANQIFSLAAGAMRAEVAKLARGQRFVIRTPNAELEARGTSFRVARVRGAPSCGADWTTKLTVFEGMVAARANDREVSIGPGQEWTAECAPASAAPTNTMTAAPPAPAAASPEPAAAHGVPPPRGLAPINDLYAEAMDAKAKGDKSHALSALEQLETLYPSSPLAESATVERMKILASTNPKAASAVAKRYLAHYPDGFARNVAEGIVAKNP